MAITAVCDICGVTLRTPDKLSGRKVKCKECGSPVQLPGEIVADAEEAAPAATGRSASGRNARKKPLEDRTGPADAPFDEPAWLFEGDQTPAAAADATTGSTNGANTKSAKPADPLEAALNDIWADDESDVEPKPKPSATPLPPRARSPRNVGRPVRSRDEDDEDNDDPPPPERRRESRGGSGGGGLEISPLIVPFVTFGICFAGSFLLFKDTVSTERLRWSFFGSLLLNQLVAWLGSMSVIAQEGSSAVLIALFVPFGYFYYAFGNFDDQKGWLALWFLSLALSFGILYGAIDRAKAERAAQNQAAPAAPFAPAVVPAGVPQKFPRGRGPRNADEVRDMIRGPGGALGNPPDNRFERGRRQFTTPPVD